MWNRHVGRSKTVDSQQSHIVHCDLLRNDNSDFLSTYCVSGAVIYLLHKLATHWRVSLSNQELPSSNAFGERGSLSQFVSREVCLCLWKSITLRLSSLSLAPSPAPRNQQELQSCWSSYAARLLLPCWHSRGDQCPLSAPCLKFLLTSHTRQLCA